MAWLYQLGRVERRARPYALARLVHRLQHFAAQEDHLRRQPAARGDPPPHRPWIENESGASLKRPELFRLLNDSSPGDVLLIEQVDRLSRLNATDWEALRTELATRKVRVVALDLPTSWTMMTGNGDEFTARMFDAINGMMLDMLAAIARKDYEDRRRRQMQGIAKARTDGLYRGRPEDAERNARIATMLKAGLSYSDVQATAGCSRATVAKVARRIQGERPFEASASA
jgi:DNA invertase Pin-like site-specific DNA recombinase